MLCGVDVVEFFVCIVFVVFILCDDVCDFLCVLLFGVGMKILGWYVCIIGCVFVDCYVEVLVW